MVSHIKCIFPPTNIRSGNVPTVQMSITKTNICFSSKCFHTRAFDSAYRSKQTFALGVEGSQKFLQKHFAGWLAFLPGAELADVQGCLRAQLLAFGTCPGTQSPGRSLCSLKTHLGRQHASSCDVSIRICLHVLRILRLLERLQPWMRFQDRILWKIHKAGSHIKTLPQFGNHYLCGSP